MAADQDVSVAVDLQQVPVLGVEPETSNREGVVVLEVHDGLRVAESHESLFQQIEAQNLNRKSK